MFGNLFVGKEKRLTKDIIPTLIFLRDWAKPLISDEVIDMWPEKPAFYSRFPNSLDTSPEAFAKGVIETDFTDSDYETLLKMARFSLAYPATQMVCFSELLLPLVKRYSDALLRKRRMLITKDAYGDWDFEPWFKELELFTKSKLSIPVGQWFDLNQEDLIAQNFNFCVDISGHYSSCRNDFEDSCKQLLPPFIDSYLEKLEENQLELDVFYDSEMDGIEYEHFVCQIFKNEGCDAHVTTGSGDHGVDVLVSIDGFSVAIQCKHYSGKVGNKAVQEIYTAKDIFDCSVAAVVANNEYTPAARQAAEKLDVYLLHHEQIPEYVAMIREAISDPE